MAKFACRKFSEDRGHTSDFEVHFDVTVDLKNEIWHISKLINVCQCPLKVFGSIYVGPLLRRI